MMPRHGAGSLAPGRHASAVFLADVLLADGARLAVLAEPLVGTLGVEKVAAGQLLHLLALVEAALADRAQPGNGRKSTGRRPSKRARVRERVCVRERTQSQVATRQSESQ